VSRLRVALHGGEVFYGNVGSRTRFDFTVVGPAVNEAARLCDLAKSLDRDLVMSSAFHDSAAGERERLVALGRFALRGVRRPQMLYTLDDPT
jgi:adenylate cyclase